MLNSVSLEELDEQFQHLYSAELKELCEVRRDLVVDSSNLETNKFEPNGITFPNLKLTEKILLGVLQWYMPKELSCLVNLWLDSNWGGEHKEIKAVLLDSKLTALGYCLVSDRWNERDFYGNILKKENLRNLCRLRIRRRKTSRPKKKVWRRGYNDKGSMRLPHVSISFPEKKLKTVSQQILEEEELNKLITELFALIDQRLWLEGISRSY